jgi:hypothetical protein
MAYLGVNGLPSQAAQIYGRILVNGRLFTGAGILTCPGGIRQSFSIVDGEYRVYARATGRCNLSIDGKTLDVYSSSTPARFSFSNWELID